MVSLKLPSKFAKLGYNERRLALSIWTPYVLCKNQYYLKSARCNMVDMPLNDAVAAWQCDTILLPYTYSLTSRPNDHEKKFWFCKSQSLNYWENDLKSFNSDLAFMLDSENNWIFIIALMFDQFLNISFFNLWIFNLFWCIL